MALEAQDAVVRLRLEHAQKFRREADEAAAGLTKIQTAAKDLNKEAAVTSGTSAAAKGGLLASLASGRATDHLGKAADHLHRIAGAAKQTAVATQGVSLAAAFGIGASVKEYIDSQSALVKLQTLTHSSKKEIAEISKFIKVTDLAASPKELAEAFYPFQSVLKDTKANIEGVTAAEKGAAIGHVTLQQSSETLIAFMRSGIKPVHDWNNEMGLMLKTTSLGKMQFGEMAETANTGLFQLAGALKIPQQGLMSIMAAVSSTGGPGYAKRWSQLMVTALAKLVGPQKGEAKKGFKKLGIDPEHAFAEMQEGEGAGFLHVLRQIENAKKGHPFDWLGSIKAIFGGARGIKAIIPALSQLPAAEKGLPQINAYNVDEAFKNVKKNDPSYQLKEVKAQAQKAAFSIGGELYPVVKQLAKILGEVLKGFTGLPKPVKKVAEYMAILAAIVSPAAYLVAGFAALGAILFKIAKFFTKTTITPVANIIADVAYVNTKGIPTGGPGNAVKDIAKTGGAGWMAKFLKVGKFGLRLGGAALMDYAIAETAHQLLGTPSAGNFLHKGFGQDSIAKDPYWVTHNKWLRENTAKGVTGGSMQTPLERALQKGVEKAHVHVHIDPKPLGEHPELNRGIERKQRHWQAMK